MIHKGEPVKSSRKIWSSTITVSAEKTVVDAARMMVKHKVRRLPVVDDKKMVIGIVTVRDLLTVSNELNELLSDLIEINREEIVEQGVCGRCSQMSDDLKRVDNVMLCPGCREEENIRLGRHRISSSRSLC